MGELQLAPSAIVDQLLQEDPTDTFEQVFERRGRVEHISPAHALLYAVLCDGLHILLVTPLNRRHLLEYEEARSWYDQDDDTHLYSFERICDFLHFDRQRIRAGMDHLLRAQAMQSEKIRPLMRRDYIHPLHQVTLRDQRIGKHRAKAVPVTFKAGESNTVPSAKPTLPSSNSTVLSSRPWQQSPPLQRLSPVTSP